MLSTYPMGGAQAVLADFTNFSAGSGYIDVVTSSLPAELQTELIDQKFTAPTLSLPAGLSFTDPPQVTIYHTTVTKVPRGLGISAIAFKYNYYIINSMGQDQMDFDTVKSNCEIREKIVRLIPTGL